MFEVWNRSVLSGWKLLRRSGGPRAQEMRSRRRLGGGSLAEGELLEERRVLSAVATVPQAALVESAGRVTTQNDTLTTAVYLGGINNDGGSSGTDWTASGSVSKSSDPWDYYKFTSTRPTHVKITLSGLSSDVDIFLRNQTKSIAKSDKSGTATEVIDWLLPAGTHYVQVKKYGSGSSNYSLRVSVGDHSTSTAVILPAKTASGGVIVNSTIGFQDSYDYYKFTISSNRGVDIYLSGMNRDADLELLNSSGRVIGRSDFGGTTPDRIRMNLSAGTYYIRVKPYSATAHLVSNYTLRYTNAVSGGYATQIGRV